MRAVQIAALGGAEQLLLADVPDPVLKPGHVLVRIAAASINPLDIKIRSGLAVPPALPAILGCDMAGSVEAVGDGITDLKPGDDVYGCVGGVRDLQGTLAERVVADARVLARKPGNLDFRQAAALPLVTITTALAFERGGMQAGEHVLIHAGAGGVGHVAVQMAKALGATVATTVGKAEDAVLTRDFGADAVILRREEAVEDYVARLTGGKGFDLVFDTVGGDNLPTSFATVRAGGRVVSINTRTTQDLSLMHSKGLTLHAVFMIQALLTGEGRERYRAILEQVTRLAEAGQLKPLVDGRRFTLETAADAHRLLESGQARGKVVVDVAS